MSVLNTILLHCFRPLSELKLNTIFFFECPSIDFKVIKVYKYIIFLNRYVLNSNCLHNLLKTKEKKTILLLNYMIHGMYFILYLFLFHISKLFIIIGYQLV